MKATEGKDLKTKAALLLMTAVLAACSASYTREGKDDFVKVFEHQIAPEKSGQFRDCYLKALNVIGSSIKFPERTSIQQFEFSEYHRLENKSGHITLTSADIYKNGKIEFYRINSITPTGHEQDAFQRCYKTISG
ncbi:hypothetical protein ACMFLR_10895 [Delftia tsuruhatensis]|uniref:hypothetical protein n=1 Tax=Delftia tsuruhatensis TaxID=180282 RepID=UPI0039BC5E76